MKILRRELTEREAAEVATWRYPPPFDVYNSSTPPPTHDYFPILDGPDFVGFVCVGQEARVVGQEPAAGTTDVGAGLRPDLLGHGVGTSLIPAIVARFGQQRLRVAVAAFNERSLRLCRSAGFVEVRRFTGPGDRQFVELVRQGPVIRTPTRPAAHTAASSGRG